MQDSKRIDAVCFRKVLSSLIPPPFHFNQHAKRKEGVSSTNNNLALT
jgi:hypothetical protein